jgi:hypothetical protein
MIDEDAAKTRTGEAAALDLARRRADQLSLLPTPAAIADAGASDEIAQRSGPGRPAGSRNKRTQEWADFVLSRYSSPLIGMAETYSRPVEDLARELGCTRLEAFKLQLQAREALAPYVHQKQPQAIDLPDGALVQIVLPVLRHAGASAISAVPVLIEESEQNQ